MDRVVANNAYRYKNPDDSLDDVYYCLNSECDSVTDLGQPMVDNSNGTHTCPTCKQTVTTNEDKLNTYAEAATQENDRRAQDISEWLEW